MFSRRNNEVGLSSLEVANDVVLPPTLFGNADERTRQRIHAFYGAAHEFLERWVARSQSKHTQLAYRNSIMQFVRFVGWKWPDESYRFFTVTIVEVTEWRDRMLQEQVAPKTINHRITCLSSFYRFLGGCASEARLPITVPNPAHVQFIRRMNDSPVRQRHSMSLTEIRRLLSFIEGESPLAVRDRAILTVLYFTGIRIGTLRMLDVAHFHDSEEDPSLTIVEKGSKRRTIGIHFLAAESLRHLIAVGGFDAGPLFRAQRTAHDATCFSMSRISSATLWRIVEKYLRLLPGAIKQEEVYDETGKPLLDEQGKVVTREYLRYTPHSIRASTATLLDASGEDILSIQQLLGHKHVTTTQEYIKRQVATKKSASHNVPF